MVRRLVMICAALVAVSLPVSAQAADGGLDPTFGGDGRIAAPTYGVPHARANGGVLLVGSNQPGKRQISAFLPSGKADPTYGGGDGIVQVTNLGRYLYGTVEVNTSDDTLWVYLSTSQPGNPGEPWTVFRNVVRYNPDGSFDTDFGDNGISADVDFTVSTLVEGDDDSIILIGFVDKMVVARRMLSDGTIDETFGGDGRAEVADLSARTFGWIQPIAVTRQSDGSYVMAASHTTTASVFRMAADGTPDATFSGDGMLVIEYGDNRSTTINGASVMSDGSILLAGYAAGNSGFGTPVNPLLAKVSPGGELDPTFSGDGLQITSFGNDNPGMSALAQFSQAYERPDGTILALGNGYAGITLKGPAAARFLPNGSLDPTFGTAGRLLIPTRTACGSHGGYSHSVAVPGADDRFYIFSRRSSGAWSAGCPPPPIHQIVRISMQTQTRLTLRQFSRGVARPCGSRSEPCAYTRGSTVRMRGVATPAAAADGRPVLVRLYRLGDDGYRLAGSREIPVEDDGDYVLTADSLRRGRWKAVAALSPTVEFFGASATQYLTIE